jgi:hypothetical protein
MTSDVKLAIVGSRTFFDYKVLKNTLDDLSTEHSLNYVEIISGGAKGADSLGEMYAKEKDIPTKIFPAEWKKYGKKAGFKRNVDIIENCDLCVCFWDGESHGTQHDINLCKEMHKPCFVYNFLKDKLYYYQNRNDTD